MVGWLFGLVGCSTSSVAWCSESKAVLWKHALVVGNKMADVDCELGQSVQV